MGSSWFPHNARAYEAAAAPLEQKGRAAKTPATEP